MATVWDSFRDCVRSVTTKSCLLEDTCGATETIRPGSSDAPAAEICPYQHQGRRRCVAERSWGTEDAERDSLRPQHLFAKSPEWPLHDRLEHWGAAERRTRASWVRSPRICRSPRASGVQLTKSFRTSSAKSRRIRRARKRLRKLAMKLRRYGARLKKPAQYHANRQTLGSRRYASDVLRHLACRGPRSRQQSTTIIR